MTGKLEWCELCDAYVLVTPDGELACGHDEDKLLQDEHYLEELDFNE